MARRTTRAALLIVLLAAFCVTIYLSIDRLLQAGPALEANQLLLPALSLALVVLVLGLAGVLIRDLVRLIVDRKRGILGSRLRTKLVFFYLALVLVPATVLFTGSSQIIKRTVEAILRTPLEDISRQSREAVDRWTDFFREQSVLRGRAVAQAIHEQAPGEVESILRRHREREDLERIWLLDARGTPLARMERTPREPGDAIEQTVQNLAEEAIRGGRPASRIDRLGDRLQVHSVVPLARGATGSAAAAVAVGLELPAGIAKYARSIDEADRAYRQFRSKRRELLRFYLTLIGLIFLATLFAATWMGFYLARRITGPIQELASAAREISTGNLAVRVQTNAGDELATLVDAFNEMAGELQENRAVITRSTAELRRSNAALDARRRYIETLLANLSTGVISLDSAGRATTANPAVERVLGLAIRPGDDVVAAFLEAGLHPLADLVEQAARSDDDGFRRDLDLPDTDGASQISVQLSPLKGVSDEHWGTLLMVEDLTDLVRAQRAAAWQEVARRIAHEIKNPLTPIQLAAQRLRKKFLSKAPDQGEVLLEATSSIEREVSGLKQLVDEFSRFARMPEVEPVPVRFAEIVDSVLALYRGLPGVDWRVRVAEPPTPVNVDAQQMRRALINLIDNALSATNGQGTIEVTVEWLPEAQRLQIEIADSGPGIPPEDRDRMFVPYFSTKRKGTGLGLAIVHKVVTDHRGSIRVEDNQPTGARFVIEIPA